jgi:superfamily II DNA or RNA helicase
MPLKTSRSTVSVPDSNGASATGSIFSQLRGRIRLLGDDGKPLLREAQYGAATAVASHFTRRSDACIVALPTGIGKTLLMQVLPFLIRSQRVLVVVQSKLLRDQIGEQLADMSLFARFGIVDPGDAKPKVSCIEHEMHSVEDWNALADSDFVVATPRCISRGIEGVEGPPQSFFDTVLVDEAHHATVATGKSF